MKKRLLAFVLIFAILFSACSGGGNKTETNEKAETTGKTEDNKKEVIETDNQEITVGYYNCDHMVPGPIGEAAGIYKAHGLNVKLTGNGKVPQAMAAGQMDAGYIGARGLVGANGEGAPIVYAANNHIGGSMYLVVSNDIEKPEDIYGQKVAIGDPSKNEGWLCGYSQDLSLSTNPEDYELVNTNSDADSYLALSTGQIKAYTCCDPWGSMAEHEGVGRIISTYYLMDGELGICCAFSMNKNFIKDHRELAKKLLHAHVDSVKYCYEHPKKAAEIFAEYYSVPIEVAMKTIYMKCVNEGRTITWKIDEGQFNHAYKTYEKWNLVENLPKIEDSVDYELYAEAELEDFDKFIKEKIDPVLPLGMTFEEFEKVANELD